MPVVQLNRDGLDIGDAEGMCCQCVEIKLGVTIIAAISLICTIVNISWACSMFNYWGTGSSLYGIIALVLTGPACLSSFFFVKWFTSDDQTNRDKLA